jgi:hypothetical protein
MPIKLPQAIIWYQLQVQQIYISHWLFLALTQATPLVHLILEVVRFLHILQRDTLLGSGLMQRGCGAASAAGRHT